ncbi:MAG: flagellin lysine-N-methylase [Clostridia bacterium]|nr:flagellin lysine-N-methylase [Clostridia bacterium]
MKEATPNYYHKFKCIADKCKHNCCIGWEIDIDEETMMLYESLDTPLGEKIRANITGDIPHFKLADGDRCPMLMENGLCEIIAEYGEDAICDICYLHPRFKNFYSDFTETGLGLACEEVARIILLETEKFSIKIPENAELTGEEKEFFIKREEIFALLSDRSISIYDRLSCLAEKYGQKFEFSLDELLNKYKSLEILDNSWLKEIEHLAGAEFDDEVFKKAEYQTVFEQLASYFIFRHLAGAIEDGDFEKRVKFTLISCYFIGALFNANLPISQEKMIDIARMYSSEIEYAMENTEAIMNL